MQTSGSWHASRASEPKGGLAPVCTGSVGLTAASSTAPVAGRGAVGGFDKVALPLPPSATSTEPVASLASFRTGSGVLGAVAWGASTCSARAVADVARLTSMGAPALSMLGESRPASPAATQPARATVTHNAANAASRRGFFTPPPSHVSPPSNGGFSRCLTANSTGPRRIAQRG
jgi:hypothetical protein